MGPPRHTPRRRTAGGLPSTARRSLACGGSRRRRWRPSVRRVRGIRLDREAPRAPRRSSCPRGMRRSSCAPCHSVNVSAVNPRSAMPRRIGMAAARIQRSSSVSASMSIDSWLVLSLRGQSKVRLLAQPGPPTQRAGPRPAARVRAGPWPSGHPRAAARCPENRPSTEPEGGSGCGDHPARVLVRQPNHRRPVTFPPK